jgi:hypothetical protein
MPAWKEGERRKTFADVPERLRHVDLNSPDSLKEERAEWLEANGLTLVDFFAWLRTQDLPGAGKRPPSRRRLLTQEQAAALDAEIEREGFQW